jgi:uncharacterized protein (TIGR00255 family)
MQSMTGYGRGEATNGGVTVVVEIKSVNNRFRDINARMPREYMVLEPRVAAIVKERVTRGRVDVYIRRSATESNQMVHADPVLAERYLVAVRAVAQRLQVATDHIQLDALLSQPGVLSLQEMEADALTEWEVVETALHAAMEELYAMRQTEGAALHADLLGHLSAMEAKHIEVSQQTEGLVDRLHKRMEERLQRLLADRFDANRVVQEAAVLADKADVSEELARLVSHFSQFRLALDSDEPVGRRLEFLVQEMNREVNTLGSKAAEHPVSVAVVEMKSVLERVREQSANVE